jgi:hypothetical protein
MASFGVGETIISASQVKFVEANGFQLVQECAIFSLLLIRPQCVKRQNPVLPGRSSTQGVFTVVR